MRCGILSKAVNNTYPFRLDFHVNWQPVVVCLADGIKRRDRVPDILEADVDMKAISLNMATAIALAATL